MNTKQHNQKQNLKAKINTPKINQTIVQLLSNLANPKEIEQYMKRFLNAGQSHFAVIKVGGSILENDLKNLCSSLSFLVQIGLFPIVVHGAGPQLNRCLKSANINCQFIEGQRVTTPAILKIAKKTFLQQNLKLANQLQAMGIKTAALISGVFTATKSLHKGLGYVGDISAVDIEQINIAINSGAIPIISPLAETDEGQSLNINADIATNKLAVALEPYKVIFLTATGGILNEHKQIISSINLITDYRRLMEKDWLNGGMKLKLKQAADILSQLPPTTSVSITKPINLAKELFTHKGSGTLLRKGESIMTHDSFETIKVSKLTDLLELSFNKKLDIDYFLVTDIYRSYITYCYRAAAIITRVNEMPFLDKFVVAENAKGEGLGKVLWEKIKKHHQCLFWRCKPNNPINDFYFKNSSGCFKTSDWNVFWYGFTDFGQIEACINVALEKKPSLMLEASL
jgi:acetylglutamate kinase